jgi:hypothetical protein
VVRESSGAYLAFVQVDMELVLLVVIVSDSFAELLLFQTEIFMNGSHTNLTHAHNGEWRTCMMTETVRQAGTETMTRKPIHRHWIA